MIPARANVSAGTVARVVGVAVADVLGERAAYEVAVEHGRGG